MDYVKHLFRKFPAGRKDIFNKPLLKCCGALPERDNVYPHFSWGKSKRHSLHFNETSFISGSKGQQLATKLQGRIADYFNNVVI
ncbi:MAG: hypothetical protein ACP5RZ_01220 [Thermoplasmata archaeon]